VGGQQSTECRESDPREICLPQKKALSKPPLSTSDSGATVTVEMERRRSSGGTVDDDDNDDDDADNDVDDVSSSDSTSDIDTAACCSEVIVIIIIIIIIRNVERLIFLIMLMHAISCFNHMLIG